MPLIDLRGVTKTYQSGDVATPVLRGISLQIAHGEFVAIMGPSGSGKSTLLHVLGFLDTQTGGEYMFRDIPNTSYTSAAVAEVRNQHIGFVFQAFNLLPRTSVFDNVRLPLLYSTIPESEWDGRVQRAIAAVGLSHRERHTPAQLSGGEKQRVAIARAVVNNPAVIFADEPTGNLDSASSIKVMDMIRELHERDGHTVVLITHETSTASYAKRIIQLRDGVIVSDTVASVATRRDTQYK